MNGGHVTLVRRKWVHGLRALACCVVVCSCSCGGNDRCPGASGQEARHADAASEADGRFDVEERTCVGAGGVVLEVGELSFPKPTPLPGVHYNALGFYNSGSTDLLLRVMSVTSNVVVSVHLETYKVKTTGNRTATRAFAMPIRMHTCQQFTLGARIECSKQQAVVGEIVLLGHEDRPEPRDLWERLAVIPMAGTCSKD